MPSSPKPRLVLAEDEPSYNAFLCELLAAEYEVETTRDGEEAWAAVERRLPDLILLDVEMPLLDGLGLLRRLRAAAHTASLPIILIAANNRREALMAVVEADADVFLIKPFHPLELLARLRSQRRLIRLRRQATELIARQAAEEVERVKNCFLACVSHELRTPLTPIHMAAHLIRMQRGLPEAVYEGVETVRRNVEIETRLINDLLDVSQIVHGKLQLSLAPADVHECLGQALSDYRQDFAAKGLKVTINLAATRHEVLGDAARLRQVFWNLLSNAAKFTPDGGRITVQSADEGDTVVVEVQDSGRGIAAEMLPTIFEPLEHGETEGKQVYGSMEIGLAIAHALITAHHGQLTATSPGLGQGSTFRVCLHTPGPPAF